MLPDLPDTFFYVQTHPSLSQPQSQMQSPAQAYAQSYVQTLNHSHDNGERPPLASDSEPTQGSRQSRLCGLPAGWFARQPCLGLPATSRNASGFDYPSCQRIPPMLALPLMLLWPTNHTRKSLEISIPFTLTLTFPISHLSLLPQWTPHWVNFNGHFLNLSVWCN